MSLCLIGFSPELVKSNEIVYPIDDELLYKFPEVHKLVVIEVTILYFFYLTIFRNLILSIALFQFKNLVIFLKYGISVSLLKEF
jgi:hypothetical protein